MKRTLIHSVVCLLALSLSALAQGPASVAGTVHDANGQAQVGVLVQLLNPDNGTVLAAAFSDKDGHYSLQTISSGYFQVRASAAMFLPVVRQNIPLNLGSRTVLDLTLNTLTEALQWLPAHPRTPSDPADDWKWTLRSPANRPILREFDPTIVLASNGGDTTKLGPHTVQARAEVVNRSAAFANSGVHQVITLDHYSVRQHDYLFRADVAPTGSQSASATGATSYEEAPGQEVRIAGNYQWHSELQIGAATPTATSPGTEMGSGILRIAQSSQLGPQLQMEAGNEIEQVGWGGRVEEVHPFAGIAIHPNELTTIRYTLSTTPGFSKADDVDGTIERAPMAAPSAHGLTLEHGVHQQIAWTRDTGSTLVTAAYFHDEVENPILQGVSTASAFQSAGMSAGYDATTGMLREAGDSYTTQGMELSLDHEFGAVDACVSLLDSNALTLMGGALQAMPATRVQGAQLADVTLRGVITRTRTHWKAGYGAESHGVLVPLSVFDLDGPGPYMNISIRQPLHGNNLEAMVEVRNLLAQGYHPFLAPDGETILFMQVPRSLQGGLVFSF